MTTAQRVAKAFEAQCTYDPSGLSESEIELIILTTEAENARTKELVAALIECSTQLSAYVCYLNYDSDPCECGDCKAYRALESALGRIEGGKG